jgi:pimeloyl-ACP methyl ester carboxylesterase
MASISKNTYKSAILSLIGFDVRDKLINIATPILLISGDEDKQAPAKTMESMSKKIKNSKYLEIKNCGHLIHLEKPEIFNRSIKKFILNL